MRNLTRALGPERSSKRTPYPTGPGAGTGVARKLARATRRATDTAATRLGSTATQVRETEAREQDLARAHVARGARLADDDDDGIRANRGDDRVGVLGDGERARVVAVEAAGRGVPPGTRDGRHRE